MEMELYSGKFKFPLYLNISQTRAEIDFISALVCDIMVDVNRTVSGKNIYFTRHILIYTLDII